MPAVHQTEIRFELHRDEVAVLDGFVQATGKSRGEVLRELLRDWSDQKRHEAILICRTAGINPAGSEDGRHVPPSRLYGQ